MSLPLVAQEGSAPFEELETNLITGNNPGPVFGGYRGAIT
jgi:hypothetical protein